MKKTLLFLAFAGIFMPLTAQKVTTYAGVPETAGYNPLTSAISSAQFTDPYGIVVDSVGRIWITEAGISHRVRMIDPAGGNIYTKSGSGAQPGSAGVSSYINGTGNAVRYNTPMGLDI